MAFQKFTKFAVYITIYRCVNFTQNAETLGHGNIQEI